MPVQRTTSGAIALSNLGTQIDGLEKELRRQPDCGSCRIGLSDALLTRAQATSSVSDLERALSVAEEAVRAQPDAASYLVRGRARAGLHLFAEAQEDLALARPLHAPDAELLALEAVLDEATGALGAALELRTQLRRREENILSLGHEAVLRGAMGEYEAADRLFVRASRAYHDVSPFPVAWVELQEGLMWQAAGRPARARPYFEQAHERLPDSLAAATHLASVTDDPDVAIGLLQPFAESEDPEPAGQLAALLRLEGRRDEARALTQRARTTFVRLLERHPQAYADHAARFWLGPGADVLAAAVWAHRNLSWRRTAAAYTLALAASRAAGDAEGACATAPAAMLYPWPDPELAPLALDVLTRCGELSHPEHAPDEHFAPPANE